MIHRQEHCLRRLARKMSQMNDSNTQPEWVVNAKSMTVIIHHIQKEPIAQARILIRKKNSGAPHVVPPLPKENPLTSRTSFTQPASISRQINVQSDPSICLVESLDLSDTPEVSSQAGAMVLRKKESGTRVVFHDYGDGNKETYEVRSIISSSRDGNSDHRGLSANAYVPVPPFSSSDWELRKQKKSGS